MADRDSRDSSAPPAGAAPKRSVYSGDIPVLNELADLIGSLDLDTPSKIKVRETDKSIAAELQSVS
jgi:hypothetical protein